MKKRKIKNKNYLAIGLIFFLILILSIILIHNYRSSTTKGGQADNILPTQSTPDLVEMKNTILSESEIYKTAPDNEKEEIANNIKKIAEDRQNLIYELLDKKDITEAKKQMLDNDLISEIPAELKEFIEEPIETDGTIEIIIADYFDEGYSEEEYFIITDDEESFKLLSIEDMESYELLPNDKVEIKGIKVKDIILIDEEKDSVEVLEENNVEEYTAQSSSSQNNTMDSRKVAVILLNFLNAQDNPPLTHADVRSMVFTGQTSANSYFKDVSFNQVELIGDVNIDGDVYGYYTLSYDNLSCNSVFWRYEANTLAAEDGFNIDKYDHVLYVIKSSTSCSGIASASNQGTYSMYESISGAIVAQELGHNFGLYHASSYRCTEGGNRVTLSNSCTIDTYGDPFDSMGKYSLRRHFNAQSKSVNWRKSGFGVANAIIPPENVITVTQTGTYTISSLENQTTTPQLIKIYRPIDYNGNYPYTFPFFFVDYREPHQPFDNYTTDPAVNGIIIRLGHQGFTTTFLLDAVPSTASFDDAPFLVGQTFTDPFTGIQITLTERTTSTATVYVNYGGVTFPECERHPPQVTITPLTSQSGNVGEALTYWVNIKNMDDSIGCPSSGFTYNLSLPSGFTAPITTARNILEPEWQWSMHPQITSNSSLASGSYDFNVTVTNSSSGMVGTATAIYNIQPPQVCIRNTPQITITPTTRDGNAGDALAYQIGIINKDTSVCSSSDFNYSLSLPSGLTPRITQNKSLSPGASWIMTSVPITSNPFLAPGSYDFNATATNLSSDMVGTATASYRIIDGTVVTTPTATPPAGTHTSAQNVSLNTTTIGATIRYTLNNANPNCSTIGTNYTTPISITQDTNIRAIACKSGLTDSGILTANYIITGTVATPTANPPAGTYNFAQSVTLNTNTPGANIRYTLDGTDPTTTSPLYTSAISIATNKTLKAKAFKTGWANSGVLTEIYNISPINYTLKYTAGAGGTLSGTTTQTVLQGGNGTPVTANANTGYHFVKWSDNSIVNPRTDTNVRSNITVTAQFGVNIYSLEYNAGSGGSITGEKTQSVTHGQDGAEVNAVSNSGYSFNKWSDGSTVNPRKDTNVISNINVTAQFKSNSSPPGDNGGSNNPPRQNTVTTESFTSDVDILSPAQVQEILEDNNLSFIDIDLEKYSEDYYKNHYEVKRRLQITKTVLSSRQTKYLSTITVSVKNISDKNLTNLKVIEIIPKEIANSASDINSTVSFKVIQDDPIIEFDVNILSLENTAEFTYSVNKQVTASQLNLAKTIINSEEVIENLPITDDNASIIPDQNVIDILEEEQPEQETLEEPEIISKEKSKSWFIYIIIGVVVCIIIVILILVFQRRKKTALNPQPQQEEINFENPSFLKTEEQENKEKKDNSPH